MKIVFVGNFGVSHSSETHWQKTLEGLGHAVYPLQEDQVTAAEVERRVAETSADLFWWTRTWGIRGDAAGMLQRLPCPSMAYHLDLYAGLARWEQVAAEPWWRCRYVFTPDGGSDDFWKAHGINHFYMKPGVFEPECYMAAPAEEYKKDVIFVGSKGYHPEWPYRPQLIEWLAKTYGNRFEWWGGPRTIRGHELNRLYASANVTVGDTLCLGFKHSGYWSDRVYETLGRGGVLVHPWIEGLEEEFTDGEHLAYYRYGDFDGLKRIVDDLLENHEKRERIRVTGHRFVRAHCTYWHRVAAALDIVAAEERKRHAMSGTPTPAAFAGPVVSLAGAVEIDQPPAMLVPPAVVPAVPAARAPQAPPIDDTPPLPSPPVITWPPCEAGHAVHERRELKIVLKGATRVSEYPAIPERLARTFKMWVYAEQYRGCRGCTGDDGVSHSLIANGVVDGYATLLALAITTMGTPGVVVDVGAHVGWWTLLALANGRHVVLTEQEKEHAALLQESVRLNGWGDRVTVLPCVRKVDAAVRLLHCRLSADMVLFLESTAVDFIMATEPCAPAVTEWLKTHGYEAYGIPTKVCMNRGEFEANPLAAVRDHHVRFNRRPREGLLYARKGVL